MNTTDETTWVLVAGGFHQRGGMDKANYALAHYLSESGRQVHLVSHDVDEVLQCMPGIGVTLVARPYNSIFLGEFALDRFGRAVKARLRSQGRKVRVLANGSSCLVGDVNWVHYVHGAWRATDIDASIAVRGRNKVQYHALCWRERIAFRRAKLILTNSNLTTNHVASCLNGNSSKINTIYLGADPMFPSADEQKAEARNKWKIPAGVPVIVFIGSFGVDARKGFDVLLKAWQRLCGTNAWNAQLLVAGDGPSLGRYRQEAEAAKTSRSIRFLGFCTDISSVLAASDLLVSPVRYEPYGLNVQEALSCGLAVLTTARAGIAERFSTDLSSLLIRDPESVEECVEKFRRWHADQKAWSVRFRQLGDALRERSWQMMSKDIVSSVDSALAS